MDLVGVRALEAGPPTEIQSSGLSASNARQPCSFRNQSSARRPVSLRRPDASNDDAFLVYALCLDWESLRLVAFGWWGNIGIGLLGRLFGGGQYFFLHKSPLCSFQKAWLTIQTNCSCYAMWQNSLAFRCCAHGKFLLFSTTYHNTMMKSFMYRHP